VAHRIGDTVSTVIILGNNSESGAGSSHAASCGLVMEKLGGPREEMKKS